MNQEYLNTVRLLLDIAPAVFASPYFAMKGGTALNLFVQDLPRLSVDIDVVFVDHVPLRDDALGLIGKELVDAKARIEAFGYAVDVRPNKTGDEVRMFVTGPEAEVKVEVNFVFRGTVLPIVRRGLAQASEEFFGMAVEVPMLDTPELYGGKLVAALDRQHPRDIFDVQCMLDKFGLQPLFLDCFVAYLAGHNRPVHEVLVPTLKPLQHMFENEFEGMTREPVTLAELEATRTHFFHELPRALTANHRQFLLSLVQAKPDFELMPQPNLKDLPAIRWKLQNLEKLKKSNPKRFALQHSELQARFDAL